MPDHAERSQLRPAARGEGRPADTSEAGRVDGVVDLLERWERFGGVWTVIARGADGITFSLRRCDGGEEQQRVCSTDPAVARWLDERGHRER